MKVFDIEDLGNGEFRAYVARPRQCTMCRECIREQKWQNKVQLGRVKDHFIFSIESTGILLPEVLFEEAVKVLMGKILRIQRELERRTQRVRGRCFEAKLYAFFGKNRNQERKDDQHSHLRRCLEVGPLHVPS
jgi:hypothetical protein